MDHIHVGGMAHVSLSWYIIMDTPFTIEYLSFLCDNTKCNIERCQKFVRSMAANQKVFHILTVDKIYIILLIFVFNFR